MTNGTVITTTDYAGNYIYQNNALQFISQPEGYLELDGQGGYDYTYQYKDHLGNIRLSFMDSDGNGQIAQSEIKEENNYYPFGLKHSGYNMLVFSANLALKYKYNGKELNDELNLDWYDYGARMYDPALGRWHTPDPLGQFYSPYLYAANNPIVQVDPDGKWSVAIHYKTTYKQMRNLGYSKEDADKYAYMASTYADQPEPGLLNPFLGTGILQDYGRFGVKYGQGSTKNSQNNDENSWRHAMMSDAEAESGKTNDWAIDRAVTNAWNSILDGAANGDVGIVGVGIHAIQDIEAHGGASNAEHLDFKNNFGSAASMCYNDMYGSTAKSEINTRGVGTIIGIISGNQKVIDKAMDKKGSINITLTKDAVNQNSLKNILDGILNSGYKGPVTFTFQ